MCVSKVAQKGSMNDHVASVHEGVKPFKCDICQYSCSEKDSMKKHVASVHEEKKAIL